MLHPSKPFGTFRCYLITLITIMSSNVTLALGLMIVSLGLTEGVSLLMLVPPLELVGLDVQQGALSLQLSQRPTELKIQISAQYSIRTGLFRLQ